MIVEDSLEVQALRDEGQVFIDGRGKKAEGERGRGEMGCGGCKCGVLDDAIDIVSSPHDASVTA